MQNTEVTTGVNDVSNCSVSVHKTADQNRKGVKQATLHNMHKRGLMIIASKTIQFQHVTQLMHQRTTQRC